MEPNVGMVDRVVRIVAGLLILGLYFFMGEPERWWSLLGLLPLATGLAAWCPVYQLFHIHTNHEHLSTS